MKKRLKNLADFFAFTKSERRGIVALLGILFFLMAGIQLIPYCYSKPHPVDYTDHLAERSTSNRTQNYAQRKKNYPQNYAQNSRNNAYSRKKYTAFTPSSSTPRKFKPVREKKTFMVQANTCDTLDLQQIKGIGSAFSKRIIKYRNQLGGFVRKDQLLEVWGIDSAKYAQIEKSFVIDRQNIRKINLNTTTIKELQNHPYLDYYQAKAIVQTRDNQGFYTHIEDLLKIALIDRETFDLIRAYLEI